MFFRKLPNLPLKHQSPDNIIQDVSKDTSQSDKEFMDFQTFTTQVLNLDELPQNTNTHKKFNNKKTD